MNDKRELLEVYVYNRSGGVIVGGRIPTERRVPDGTVIVDDGTSLKFYRDPSIKRSPSNNEERNKLAGKAMESLIAKYGYRYEDVENLVEKSYEIAEAMMARGAQ